MASDFGAQDAGAFLFIGEGEIAGETGEHEGAQRGVRTVERGCRLLEEVVIARTDVGRLPVSLAQPERGARELLGRSPAGCAVRGGQERVARSVVAGVPLHTPEQEQDFTTCRLVVVVVEQHERPAKVLGGLLVGEQLGGAPAGRDRVLPGGRGTRELPRELEVMRQLGRVDGFGGRQALQRLGNPLVQAHATAGRQLSVQDVSNERVRERVRVEAIGQLDDEAGGQGFLQRRHDVRGCGVDELLDDLLAEFPPDHRRRVQRLRRDRRQVTQAASDDLGDALGHAECAPAPPLSPLPAAACPDSAKRPERLLDEEGVAAGLFAQAPDEAGRDFGRAADRRSALARRPRRGRRGSRGRSAAHGADRSAGRRSG